jgi:hypothetical protein
MAIDPTNPRASIQPLNGGSAVARSADGPTLRRGGTTVSVRPFTRNDIPQVADLYRRVYLPTYPPNHQATLLASLARYFEDVFFAGPWRDERISSLVCDDGTGRVAGFIGVVPRRMRFKGRTICAANSFHLMTDPRSRSTLAGVRLLKYLFAGPQDLTFSDHGGDLGRRVWEGVGGTIALVQSLNWVRVLRPARYALQLAGIGRPRRAAFAWVVAPVARMMDRGLAWAVPRWLPVPTDSLAALIPDEHMLLRCLEQLSSPYAVRPEYEPETLSWLIKRAKRSDQLGELQQVVLRDTDGKLVGSYLYYLQPAGLSNVLQLAAKPGAAEHVLDHLFRHAWQRGAEALSGRLDPRLMREMTNRYCRFDGAGGWTMVHTSDQELLLAVCRGDIFLSRLEGELCLFFQPPIPDDHGAPLRPPDEPISSPS